MQTCLKCKLGSPDEALRCDCGYDFVSGKIEKSYNLTTAGINVEMLEKAKVSAKLWLTACLILLVVVVVLRFTDNSGLLSLFVAIPFIICCSLYMQAKGYSWWWGLCGIFSILGLLFLVSRPFVIQGHVVPKK